MSGGVARGDAQLLTFTLEGGRYALPLEHVREVVRAALPARLPKAPAIVEGVLDLHGELVPLLDVRGRFGLSALPLDPSQHFVIAAIAGRAVAFAVDEALDLVRVANEAITAAAAVAADVEHVAGIAQLPDGLVVIYDLRAFLSADEVLGIDRALAEATPA